MATITEVANAAFVQIGADPVLNVIDDTGGPAIAFNAVFEITRSAFLAAHPWDFSIKTATLVKLSGPTPAEEYTGVYALPVGYLAMVRSDNDRLDGFSVLNDGLHANQVPIINYHYDVPIDEFTATAVAAFTVLMAWNICIPVKGSNTMYANLERKYERFLKEARHTSRASRRERKPVSLEEARFTAGVAFDASHPSAF